MKSKAPSLISVKVLSIIIENNYLMYNIYTIVTIV